jgi:ferritin-like metal-binding protein YciE
MKDIYYTEKKIYRTLPKMPPTLRSGGQKLAKGRRQACNLANKMLL